MQNFQVIFCVLISAAKIALCDYRHSLYERDINHEDDQQLLSALKDHDIVPDILDDASGTGPLEVKVNCYHLKIYC